MTKSRTERKIVVSISVISRFAVGSEVFLLVLSQLAPPLLSRPVFPCPINPLCIYVSSFSLPCVALYCQLSVGCLLAKISFVQLVSIAK